MKRKACCDGLTSTPAQLSWETLQRRHREGAAELDILEHATAVGGFGKVTKEMAVRSALNQLPFKAE